ncbi:MAG: amino acid ABC transporter permease [Clostridiales bacterium]|jgi:His/Glu/Gln/Arg/opine family amino acid ABC transporter permease subunit|nr:amino acid ABC transporter permease [Clostridiales bacterium]
MGQPFWSQFVTTFIEKGRYLMFLEGLGRTLIIALCAVVIGVALGIVAAVIKVYNHRTGGLKPLRALVDIYLQIFRGTPVVVQLLIWYYIILVNVKSGLLVAIIGFGINSGAYVAEIFRAGIMSVDLGQSEAGRSLGLSEMQSMRYIILPQAIKNTLPALFNEFISLLKETSVAGYITVIDLTKAGDLVRSRTMLAFFPLLSVALVYFILVAVLTQLQANLERRLRKGER